MRIFISKIRQGKVKPKRKFRLQSTHQGLYCMLGQFLTLCFLLLLRGDLVAILLWLEDSDDMKFLNKRFMKLALSLVHL